MEIELTVLEALVAKGASRLKAAFNVTLSTHGRLLALEDIAFSWELLLQSGLFF